METNESGPREADRLRPEAPAIPDWVRGLGTAVWVTAPDRTVRYLNRRAAELLGISGTGVGCPCHTLVRGRDERGEPFCGPGCRIAHLANAGHELPPVVLQIDGDQGVRWLEVLVIPVTAPDGSGPWLVHCASNRTREQRAATYLRRVAARTTSRPAPAGSSLTRREHEILHRLADDEDLHDIARHLHLSHNTVRNHVQHIMTKLGVHSMLEAVAVHLLEPGNRERRDRRCDPPPAN